MIISIIAAMGRNHVIGMKNALPWQMPKDLVHFQQLTAGKPVIMGQKTFESIGKPLPGRTNIVMTLDKDYNALGCIIVHSIEEALEAAKDFPEAMICGGASIYRQFLPLADRMYLTLIEGDFNGDAFVPEFNRDDWKEIERVDNQPDESNPYKCTFLVLEKIQGK